MPDDVARLVLGTAALGLRYGLPEPGDGPARQPPAEEAVARLVEQALAQGIGTFDTAPAYGDAEARLGKALAGRGRVWTKVGSASAPEPAVVMRSLEASLRRLGRERLDLLSWHNWTSGLLDAADFRQAWKELRAGGASQAYGATTYGASDALAAIASGLFSVVQIEWNLFNQKTLATIRSAALAAGVRVSLRSVFLQGVLTSKGRRLPAHLADLQDAVARAAALAARAERSLAGLALRAALDQPVEWVLAGLDSEAGLAEALAAARATGLAPALAPEIESLDRSADPLVDPRSWPRA